MAEYKGIKGFKVQTVSTDPAASAIAGGTWASGGSLNTARMRPGAGTTGEANGCYYDRRNAPNPGFVEIYNGTSLDRSY
jgi:hypothetical protein